jgi:pimeloyl-ACP methyl ester carboxylesterase
VWDNFVSNLPYKDVGIVAHSYGGVVTFTLLAMREEELLKRVFAVAFTDSVHFGYASAGSSQTSEWITKIARNWVSSDKPLDTPLSEGKVADVPRVSAGTTVHEATSSSSINSVFTFLNAMLEKRSKAA